MKLKVFDVTNSASARVGESKISFQFQGQINITQSAVEILKFKVEDKFSIIQDEGEERDWYLVKDKNGFTSRKYSGSDALVFNCSKVSKLILEACGKEKSVSCKLITDPIKQDGFTLYPIIVPKPE